MIAGTALLHEKTFAVHLVSKKTKFRGFDPDVQVERLTSVFFVAIVHSRFSFSVIMIESYTQSYRLIQSFFLVSGDRLEMCRVVNLCTVVASVI